MNFMIIVVLSQFIDLGIGLNNLVDVFDGKKSRQPILPEKVLAFHLPLGLWSGCILEVDPDPLQDFSQVREQFRHSIEKETVVVHIQRGW